MNFTSFLTYLFKGTAEAAIKRDANTTICYAIYQPHIPKELSHFKREKNDK